MTRTIFTSFSLSFAAALVLSAQPTTMPAMPAFPSTSTNTTTSNSGSHVLAFGTGSGEVYNVDPKAPGTLTRYFQDRIGSFVTGLVPLNNQLNSLLVTTLEDGLLLLDNQSQFSQAQHASRNPAPLIRSVVPLSVSEGAPYSAIFGSYRTPYGILTNLSSLNYHEVYRNDVSMDFDQDPSRTIYGCPELALGDVLYCNDEVTNTMWEIPMQQGAPQWGSRKVFFKDAIIRGMVVYHGNLYVTVVGVNPGQQGIVLQISRALFGTSVRQVKTMQPLGFFPDPSTTTAMVIDDGRLFLVSDFYSQNGQHPDFLGQGILSYKLDQVTGEIQGSPDIIVSPAILPRRLINAITPLPYRPAFGPPLPSVRP